MIEQKDLIDQIKAYNPALEEDFIARAYDYAKEKHDGQTRSSGEPYYTHPVEVASILADMRLDPELGIQARLHLPFIPPGKARSARSRPARG